MKRLHETLGVSRHGYYQWKAASGAAVIARIRAAHQAGRGAYGSLRITVELREAGERVNRERV